MSEQSSLSLERELPNPRCGVIQSVLDGHLSAEAAAPELAAVSLPDPDDDVDENEFNVSEVWDTLLVFLEQDPSIVKVVADLIFHVSRLPPVLTKSGAQLTMNEGLLVWGDCPFLALSLGEEMNSMLLCLALSLYLPTRLILLSIRRNANRATGKTKRYRVLCRKKRSICDSDEP